MSHYGNRNLLTHFPCPVVNVKIGSGRVWGSWIGAEQQATVCRFRQFSGPKKVHFSVPAGFYMYTERLRGAYSATVSQR